MIYKKVPFSFRLAKVTSESNQQATNTEQKDDYTAQPMSSTFNGTINVQVGSVVEVCARL